jgi:hypothetical protein
LLVEPANCLDERDVAVQNLGETHLGFHESESSQSRLP